MTFKFTCHECDLVVFMKSKRLPILKGDYDQKNHEWFVIASFKPTDAVKLVKRAQWEINCYPFFG